MHWSTAKLNSIAKRARARITLQKMRAILNKFESGLYVAILPPQTLISTDLSQ